MSSRVHFTEPGDLPGFFIWASHDRPHGATIRTLDGSVVRAHKPTPCHPLELRVRLRAPGDRRHEQLAARRDDAMRRMWTCRPWDERHANIPGMESHQSCQ